MAKKRAPVTVVAVAMAFPIAAKGKGQQMCRLRSVMRALDQVARMETAKVRNQTAKGQREDCFQDRTEVTYREQSEAM